MTITSVPQPEAEANARLIAAAPTMYDYIAKMATTDPEAKRIVEAIHGSC